MEIDGIRKLKRNLDRCLLARASELCGSAPTIGSVYELQGLAEVHCYLSGICLLGGQPTHLQLSHL